VPVRLGMWAAHLALPAAGLWLLLAQPSLDVRWQQPVVHFWLVGTGAAVNVGLAVVIDRAARHRGDGRLFLVAVAFATAAAFLGLHALATPDVLVGATAGWVDATSFGLFVAAGLMVASTLERSLLPWRWALHGAIAALVVGWAGLSLLGVPPLGVPSTGGPYLSMLSIGAATGFVVAALRFWALYRRRPGVVLLSLVTACAVLAEGSVAIVLGHGWHLSWWAWHLLLAAGFGLVAYSAYAQYQREGGAAGLFDGVAAENTMRAVRDEYAAALEQFAVTEPAARPAIIERFGLTEGQGAVLSRAAEALAADRDQIMRLDALVRIGQESSVVRSEAELVRAAEGHIASTFGPGAVRIRVGGAAPAGTRTFPVLDAGGIDVAGVCSERDEAVLRSLASQLSLGIANVRLYRQVEMLFRQYLSPDVAAALLADPGQAALGGAVVEVTALFADLRGFTMFSEMSSPEEIVALLNRYFEVATRCVLAEGGTVVQFVGDALLALFNAPARQPDHARRAAAAALALQSEIERIAAVDEPRFRVGINTGPALVGNIGSEALRNFNAMGDAVNVASRLQSLAEPGTVVIGGATATALDDSAVTRFLGDMMVKGRQAPVPTYLLERLV
jgi:adenylate cyclase